MSGSLGTSPGFERHPQHGIEIRSAKRRWQVWYEEELLADSGDALVLQESNYAPVVYFPRADVRLDRLVETETKTTCPFKGEASYFRIDTAGQGDDVAWTYPATYTEVSPIAGHVAFYANRVRLTQTNNSQ